MILSWSHLTQKVTLGVAATVVAVLAFAIQPAGDDWATLRPIFEWSPRLLLPGLFWRPIDTLLRHAGGHFPALHVAWMHAWTVAGHLLSVILVWALARRATPQAASAPGQMALLFCLWSGNAASVLSPDAATQTWSTACGLLATVLVLRHLEGRRGGWLWGIAFAVAALWKENGVVWAVAAPALAYWLWAPQSGTFQTRTDVVNRRRGIALALIGCTLAVGYFAVRFLLAGRVALGDEAGRYAIDFSLDKMILKATLLLGAAAVPVDTLALFGTPRILVVALATAFLAVPFLWLLITAGGQALVRRNLSVLGLASLVGSPTVVLGRVSEMYVHPIAAVFFVCAAAPWSLVERRLPKGAMVGLILVIASSLFVFGHKAVEMHRSGKVARAIAEKVDQAISQSERPCLLRNAASESAARGYSVFQFSPGAAAAWGESLAVLHDWRLPVPVVKDSGECSRICQTLLQVSLDGQVMAVACPGNLLTR